MSKCTEEESINSIVNRYLKRRNFNHSLSSNSNGNSALSSQSNGNKFTVKELITNELLLNLGSYDHIIEMATNMSNKTNYFSDCDKCIDELIKLTQKAQDLDHENELSLLLCTFTHLFIDLYLNDHKLEAKNFFYKNQNKFTSSDCKQLIELIMSSIKNQQLDKKLIKFRHFKTAIFISERDHKLLLSHLENENLSRNLHQIINQNFCFTITSNQQEKQTKILKKSHDSVNQINSVFEKIFKNQKTNFSNEFLSSNADDKNKNPNENNLNESNASIDLKLKEFDNIVKKLKFNKPSLPELLVYNVNSGDDHICCANVRNDLQFCCIGCESSEIVVFPINDNYFLDEYHSLNKTKYLKNSENDYVEEIENSFPNETKKFSLLGHYDSVLDMKFVPKTNYLVTCSTDTNVILWDLLDNKHLKRKYFGHSQSIFSLDVNCLGSLIATASRDYTSRLFNLEKPTLIRTFIGHQNSVNCVTFHPNSNYLATGSTDHTVRMWDVNTSNMVRVFNGHKCEIYSLAFSPNGKYLVSSGENKIIKIWDLASGRLYAELISNHTKLISSLSFDNNGSLLVSSGMDQLINIWNFKSIHETELSSKKDNIHSILSPLLSKRVTVKIRRTNFVSSDLAVAIGT